MKKFIVIMISLIALTVMFTSCADSKTFTDNKGTEFTAEPYGWATTDTKIDTVVYKPNAGNIVLSILFCETVVVPIWLTGWELYEPVRLKDSKGR